MPKGKFKRVDSLNNCFNCGKKLRNMNYKYCSIKCRKEKVKFKKARNPLTNRFLIFQRDKFKCRICGISVKDGARLEIDHWIPKTRGGKDIFSNLVTLCKICNVHKNNIIPKISLKELL